MNLTENWTFWVELKNTSPSEDSAFGACLVDLSAEEDRGDIEPYVDSKDGTLHCTLGVEEEGYEIREINRVWEYWDDQPFNEKFPFFRPIPMADFVRRICDATVFDGSSEDDIIDLKEHYGVLTHLDIK